MHAGRGGAGNTFKAPSSITPAQTATGPASLFTTGLPKNTNYNFSSGRGGAGNILHSSERAIFSFDEELERQKSREQRVKEGAVFYVGRGGAGNRTKSKNGYSARKDSSSSGGDADSQRSQSSSFWGRISGDKR
jgi:hypothetical protein